MAHTITQRQLRNESGEIMRALDRGEEFIVTRNGVPVGELRPYRKSQFVPAEEIIELFKGTGRIDLKKMREEADRYVDQDPTPRN